MACRSRSRSAGAGGIRWPPLGLKPVKELFRWEVLVNDGSMQERVDD